MRYAIVMSMLLAASGVYAMSKSSDALKGSETCNPEAFQFLVGEPTDALEGILTPETVRVLGPDSMATMDHRPDRLNIDHSDDNVITRAWCG